MKGVLQPHAATHESKDGSLILFLTISFSLNIFLSLERNYYLNLAPWGAAIYRARKKVTGLKLPIRGNAFECLKTYPEQVTYSPSLYSSFLIVFLLIDLKDLSLFYCTHKKQWEEPLWYGMMEKTEPLITEMWISWLWIKFLIAVASWWMEPLCERRGYPWEV